MNNEWREWTKHNLKRGCRPEELKEILQKNGFSEEEILSAMLGVEVPSPSQETAKQKSGDQNLGQHRNEFGALSSVDYSSLTTPRLLGNPNLKKIESDNLQLYVLDNFMDRPECEAIIKEMNKNLRPSTITTGKDYSGFRTSTTCDLGNQKSKISAKIDKKISNTLGININWSEVIQGQKYEVGQEFKAHTDYFEPHTKEFETFAKDMGQRTWTFMVYLNTTKEGGGTHFTKLDEVFYPKMGRAVIWNNLDREGRPNPWTIHHGTPVVSGTKLIITKWFRDKGKGQMLAD